MNRKTLLAFVCLAFSIPCYSQDIGSLEDAGFKLASPEDFPNDGRYKDMPGVMPVIPQNTADPTYDAWKIVRGNMSEGREPGPIDIQRQPFGVGNMGIPTFFRLPIALTPEDLQVGDVDVAFIGAYTDMGLGHRGASRGPTALRASQYDYIGWGMGSQSHMGTMINPF